jgi:hypothetical protein
MSSKESSLPVYGTDKDSSLSDILWNILFFPFSLQTFTNRVDSSSILLPNLTRPARPPPLVIKLPPETPTRNKYFLLEYDLRPYGLGLVVDLGW